VHVPDVRVTVQPSGKTFSSRSKTNVSPGVQLAQQPAFRGQLRSPADEREVVDRNRPVAVVAVEDVGHSPPPECTDAKEGYVMLCLCKLPHFRAFRQPRSGL